MKHVINLTVRQAPKLDREKLRVRINSNDKPEDINWYDYIELKNVQGNKKIICKLHGDDIPEIENKRSSVIYVNEPLRGKLSVTDSQEYKFEINRKTRNFLKAWSYFIRYHPDDTVRVSTWLAIIAIIIAIVLGTLSIVLTVLN